MAAYLLRRLLLVVPTLFGILLVNFILIQFVPGGPIEQIVARLESDASATDRITGGGGGETGGGGSAEYRGAQGLPPDFIADLEKQFGFDKPARSAIASMRAPAKPSMANTESAASRMRSTLASPPRVLARVSVSGVAALRALRFVVVRAAIRQSVADR